MTPWLFCQVGSHNLTVTVEFAPSSTQITTKLLLSGTKIAILLKLAATASHCSSVYRISTIIIIYINYYLIQKHENNLRWFLYCLNKKHNWDLNPQHWDLNPQNPGLEPVALGLKSGVSDLCSFSMQATGCDNARHEYWIDHTDNQPVDPCPITVVAEPRVFTSHSIIQTQQNYSFAGSSPSVMGLSPSLMVQVPVLRV